MGKRLWPGLAGLIVAGVVVWGCQNNRPGESKPPPLASNQQQPGQPAATAGEGPAIQRTAYQVGDKPLRIEAAILKPRRDAGEPMTVLDVRWPQAWAAANTKMAGAVPCPPPDFPVSPA
jgi:hypothetical protein